MTRPDTPAFPDDRSDEGIALVDLVNRTLDRGVLLSGDAVIRVADVDLVRLTLDVVLSAVDAFETSGDDVSAAGDGAGRA